MNAGRVAFACIWRGKLVPDHERSRDQAEGSCNSPYLGALDHRAHLHLRRERSDVDVLREQRLRRQRRVRDHLQLAFDAMPLAITLGNCNPEQHVPDAGNILDPYGFAFALRESVNRR